MYRFMRVDDCDGRAYYRRRARIYCIQDEGGYGRRRLEFYRCTADGEPSYPVEMPDAAEFDEYVEP